MPPIVRAEGLYKFHEEGGQKSVVLRDVTLAVEPGEFVCVMGPSGSGKSTLLHLLSGLDEPSAGKVELGGVALATLSEERRTLQRRAHVGYVFQFFNLLANLTVFENVGLPLSIAGKRPDAHRAEIDKVLARLGIGAKANA